jgi:hypothetical protein
MVFMLCTSLPVSEREGMKHIFGGENMYQKWLKLADTGIDMHRGHTDPVTVRTVAFCGN